MTYPTPLLMFADPQGLALPTFNTLRLGGGWDKRVEKGDRVFLGVKNEVIGSAKVVYVEVGKAPRIIEKYAATNHTERQRRMEDPEWSECLARARILELMRRTYGPMFTENRNVTAIGLSR